MIPYSTQSIDQDDIDAVVEVLKSPFLTQGKRVEAFENEVCGYIGVKHCVSFNSATTALFALYSVLGFGKEDEIITTPISFVATSNMFVTLQAKPIWCDIKPDGNIDEGQIQKLITPKTKAIVGVDFGGKPLEHTTIAALAKEHNLVYIDDASHAFGSAVNGKKVGTFADASVFSFHAIKPFTTGEGGAVVCDDESLAEKLRLFRSHGIVKKELWDSNMQSMGYNFRLTEIAAALGSTQLKKLDTFIAKREQVASFYDEYFKNEKLFTTQKISSNQKSSRHLYAVLLKPELYTLKEEIFKELHKRGIGVQVHYKPIYKNSYYQNLFGKVSLKVTEDFYKSEISLPCHQKMGLDDAKFVAENFLEVVHKYSHKERGF